MTGNHSLGYIEPDIYSYRLEGTLEVDHMKAIVARQLEWQGEPPYMLAVVDVRHLGRVSAGALRAVREGRSAAFPRAVALFGASFATRVAADMLFRALATLDSKFVRFRFFDTEAQCLAWLEEMRPHVLEYARKLAKAR